MSNKFLTDFDGADLSDGSADIFVNSITLNNLDASSSLRTNPQREITTSKLPISDITGLQDALDNNISNPFNGTLQATDFKTDNITSIETAIQDLQNNPAGDVNSTATTSVNDRIVRFSGTDGKTIKGYTDESKAPFINDTGFMRIFGNFDQERENSVGSNNQTIYSDTNFHCGSINLKSFSSDKNNLTTINPNRQLGRIQFSGGQGTGQKEGCRVQSFSGNWTGTDTPTNYEIWTTANSEQALTRRFRIEDTGNTKIENGDLDVSSNKVINVADGVDNNDAVNLQQLNNAIGGQTPDITNLQNKTQNIDEANTDATQTFFNQRIVADDLVIPNYGSVKDRVDSNFLTAQANQGNIVDNNFNISVNAGNITSLENLTQNIDEIATNNTQTTFSNLVVVSDLQTDNIPSLEAKITELENESSGNDTAITNLQSEQTTQNNRLDTLETQNQNQSATVDNTVFVGDIQKGELRDFTNNTTTDSADDISKLYDANTGNTFSLGGVQNVSFDVNYIKQFIPSGSIRFTSGAPDNFTCDFEQTLLNDTVVTDTPTNQTSFTLSRNIEELKGLVCRNRSNPEGFGTDLTGIFINGERLLDGTFNKSVLTEKDISQNTNDISALQTEVSNNSTQVSTNTTDITTLQAKTSPLIDDGNVLTVRKDSANISLVPRGITDGLVDGFLRGGIVIQGISDDEYPLISYNVWDGSGGVSTGDVVNFFCQNDRVMSLTNDTTPNRMTVTGDVFANTFQNISDERLKTNIIPLENDDAINLIKDIDPICYDFEGSTEIGFSSQNLQSVDSKMVTVTDIERDGVSNVIFVKPSGVTAIAVSSIKHINERTPEQGSFVFSANSVLYNDGNIELLWDGVNKQPQFRSTQTTFHDGFITFSKPYGGGLGGADPEVVFTNFTVNNGANTNLNYFNDGGTRDADYDADENFGAEYKISIRCDTDGQPMYLFNLFIGNCQGVGNNGFYEAKKINQSS